MKILILLNFESDASYSTFYTGINFFKYLQSKLLINKCLAEYVISNIFFNEIE